MDKEKTFLYVIIALITLLLCTTISTCVYKYKYDRLVAEHRQQLELYRTKSEQYENTYRQARETNRESLENAYQNQLQLYQDLDDKYQKSELDTKRWKTCSIVLSGVTISMIGVSTTLIIILAKK